jgi:hypothetical protein
MGTETLICILGFCFYDTGLINVNVQNVQKVQTVTVVAPCQDPPAPLVACEPEQ